MPHYTLLGIVPIAKTVYGDYDVTRIGYDIARNRNYDVVVTYRGLFKEMLPASEMVNILPERFEAEADTTSKFMMKFFHGNTNGVPVSVRRSDMPHMERPNVSDRAPGTELDLKVGYMYVAVIRNSRGQYSALSFYSSFPQALSSFEGFNLSSGSPTRRYGHLANLTLPNGVDLKEIADNGPLLDPDRPITEEEIDREAEKMLREQIKAREEERRKSLLRLAQERAEKRMKELEEVQKKKKRYEKNFMARRMLSVLSQDE